MNNLQEKGRTFVYINEAKFFIMTRKNFKLSNVYERCNLYEGRDPGGLFRRQTFSKETR